MTLYETVRMNLSTAMRGRSQAECSRNVDRSRSWISDLIRARRGGSIRSDITLGTLEQIAMAVGVPPYSLLFEPIDGASEQALIFECHYLAHRIIDVMPHIRSLIRERGAGMDIVRTFSAQGSAEELAASLGAIGIDAEGSGSQPPPRTGGTGSSD